MRFQFHGVQLRVRPSKDEGVPQSRSTLRGEALPPGRPQPNEGEGGKVGPEPGQEVSNLLPGEWEAQIPGNQYWMEVLWDAREHRFKGFFTKRVMVQVALVSMPVNIVRRLARMRKAF